MRQLFELAGRVLAGMAFCVGVLSAGLLAAWQMIVVGLVNGPLDLVIASLAGVAAFVLLLAVHELGHLIAGRIVGLDIRSLTVGFLRVEWNEGRTRLKLNSHWHRMAAIVYMGVQRANCRQVAVMVAGGPAASVLVGVGCLLAATWANSGPPDVAAATRSTWGGVAMVWPGSAFVAWLNLTGLVSLSLGALTLYPGRSGGIRTDGGQLLDLALGRWTPSQEGMPKQYPQQ